MAKEAVFTLKLEPELRDEFMAAAELTHRPASQIVRELMRDFVARQRAARVHEASFLAAVERGMRDADDPAVTRLSHDDVKSKWRHRRAELATKAEVGRE